MNWRNPENELPKEGDIVWCMLYPHKETVMSIQIVCGEVEYHPHQVAVYNNDELGWGGIRWILKQIDEDDNAYDQFVMAWLPKDEMPMPPPPFRVEVSDE